MTTLNSKKRGRPLGSKNKTTRSKNKAVGGSKPFKQFNPMQQALKKITELEIIRSNLHDMIDNLEHKAVQYQAVISYLEHKLEQK